MASNDKKKNSAQISFFGNANTEQGKPNSETEVFPSDDAYTEPEEPTEDDLPKLSTPLPISEEELEITTDAEVAPEHMVRPQRVQTTSTETLTADFSEKKKKLNFDFRYQNSIIIAFFIMLGNSISRMFRNSLTAAIFTSFRRTGALFKESYLYNVLFTQKTERLTANLKSRIRKVATLAQIPRAINTVYSAMMRIKTRVYGFGILAFGITTLSVHYFINTNFDIFAIDIYAPVTGVVVLLVAFFLLIYGKTFSTALKESILMSTLLFGFLGIKRPSFSENDEFEFPISGACIIGTLLGAITVFYQAHIILSAILIMIYTLVVIKYPETGIISLILIIPFLPIKGLVFICLVITFSYIFKVLTGKRTLSFEFADIFTGMFLILTLLSEIFTFGQRTNILFSTSFILVYFICICTLRDKAWFDRAVSAITLESCMLAAYSILASFLGDALEISFDHTVNTDYGSNAGSVLFSSSTLAVFLICSIFYLLSAFLTSKSRSNRFGYIFFMLAALLYIYVEASIIVKIAFTIALLLYLTLKSSKTLIFVVLAIAIVPLLPLFNNGIYSGFITLLSEEHYRLDIWNSVINMLPRYGLTGIGNAPDAFSTLYNSYYVKNSTGITHTHSLILQIVISLGFVGIFLFAAIIFFILQGSFSFGRNSHDKNSRSRLFCYAGMCAVITMTVTGIAEYIWFNPRLSLLFWLFCGLTVCARRSANELSVSDELLLELEENYYG